MQGDNKPNQLIHEKSPYLLQHAYNPVNWYPWEKKAFKKAKQENKPIFLSIGYSTCHWCHVMASESFENEAVAAILNEHYVSIKVDREERPDIDAVYMKICQMMTGQGGWPLTIIMTPEQIPFYAGTYFPREGKYGLPGLMEVLLQLHKKYEQDPAHISEVTNSVQSTLVQTTQVKGDKRLQPQALHQTFEQLYHSIDMTYGGFGTEPKFPQPQNLLFLFEYHYYNDHKMALQMIEKTLIQMAKGGIYDHIGFGFSRYATDRAWLIPHFEKMLYDNALLLYVYSTAFQITKNPFYQEISEQIILFISREMTNEAGAFYSAIDADTEGVEGKYYVWDFEEIYEVLGEEDGDLFADCFGFTPTGNFAGKNIPNRLHSNLREIAADHGLTLEQLEKTLKNVRGKLLSAREKRVSPHVDDKILSGWNSMMIAALAKAGRVFSNKQYVTTAKKTLQFIEENLIQQQRLMARYRDGETKFKGYLDDEAFLTWAYIELYEATFDLSFLTKAKHRMEQMISLFWDEIHGGFFQTGKDAEVLLSREKEVYDGALPSGNGMAANVLMKLSSLTGELAYKDKAETMLSSFYEDVNEYAAAAAFFTKSLFYWAYPTKEVVIIGDAKDPKRQKILQQLQASFLPNITMLVAENPAEFSEIAPFAANYRTLNGKTTVYVCENFTCQQPTTDINTALDYIFNLK